MPKIDLPDGWVHQAYRFEVDRPTGTPAIASHEGARRYAWNWGLSLVEEQTGAREAYRLLALRQGASTTEADQWTRTMMPVPWSREALRRTWNETKAEPVKTFETKSQDFFCRSLWTVGLLIQETVGSLGGEGRRPQKRRGLAA
ncbi:MAG: hypothetical protein ACYDH5_12315 [Acidimicrobiales bacterium]